MRSLLGPGIAVAMALACAAEPTRGERSLPSRAAARPDISWSPESGLVSCRRDEVVLPIPPEFRDRLQVTASEAVLQLPDTRAALIVTAGETGTADDATPSLLGDFPRIWAKLHQLATGLDLRAGQVSAEAVLLRRGHLTLRYLHDVPARPPEPATGQPTPYRPSGLVDIEDARDMAWMIDYREAGRCRIAAIDRAEREDRPRLIPLLDALRVAPVMGR